ncbi:kinase-like domain-containing protein [Lophiotrema nucula]|uniref:Kinase-like domain-containing protein n=1 Tax=Lophiotrema nucula TaxID=690887 RepID=A0A6A5YW82_9PLEO|nr:kinase-like domain-containing protein [Lophiotrema nucula]
MNMDSQAVTTDDTEDFEVRPRKNNQIPHYFYKHDSELPFRPERSLGQGGFTRVDQIRMFRGKPMVYARKSFVISRAGNPRYSISDMLNETDIMGRLPHVHTMPVAFTYEIIEKLNQTFGIVMPIVADMNLEQYFDHHEFECTTSAKMHNICKTQLYRWSGCLIRALEFIHRYRVRHKDIKPQNILIKGDNVIISDFGLSKFFAGDITTQTFSDPLPRGTPRYWAPEVGKEYPDREPRNRASDVWSMGCVCLEMLTFIEEGNLLSLKDIKHYSNDPDALLGSIFKNKWAIENTTVAFLCWMMLNPQTDLRLKANELLLLVRDCGPSPCGRQACQDTEGHPRGAFCSAIQDYKTIFDRKILDGDEELSRWEDVNTLVRKNSIIRAYLDSNRFVATEEKTHRQLEAGIPKLSDILRPSFYIGESGYPVVSPKTRFPKKKQVQQARAEQDVNAEQREHSDRTGVQVRNILWACKTFAIAAFVAMRNFLLLFSNLNNIVATFICACGIGLAIKETSPLWAVSSFSIALWIFRKPITTREELGEQPTTASKVG